MMDFNYLCDSLVVNSVIDMNQNFSSQQLLKLCQRHELETYGLTKEELIAKIDSNFNIISSGTFEFEIEVRGDVFIINDLAQKLVLRKLNDNIKRLYKDEQANRRLIIKQVKTLLEENIPMWILKTDIEGFYENINREKILAKLANDNMLSFHSIWLINKLFNNPIVFASKGLPRGLNISSTLSEMYMRRFDRKIQRERSIYFYARFVDDIIIFGNDVVELRNINNRINEYLEEGLKKKEVKTSMYDGANIRDNKPLEYLGYKFITTSIKNKKTTTVSIANKKINKIKTRITLSFLDYIKNSNFTLLTQRMSFLAGNYSIKKSEEGEDLKAGIFYNYCYLTDYSILSELNTYYRKLLFSKVSSFGRKLNGKLTPIQKDKLIKYSFVYGHKHKVYTAFTLEQMREITNCWK